MGCLYAADADRFYSQEKNATETFLRYEKMHEGLNHWTEVCGFTSLWNGCEAMGKPLGGLIRPADLMFSYANTPANFGAFAPWRGCVAGEVPGNRVQGWFPQVLKDCFAVDAQLHTDTTFDQVVAMVQQGHAVQLYRKVGHFVVAVDYNQTSDALIYWDSFHLFIGDDESLSDDGTNGFRRLCSRTWFGTAMNDSVVEVLAEAS